MINLQRVTVVLASEKVLLSSFDNFQYYPYKMCRLFPFICQGSLKQTYRDETRDLVLQISL